MYPRTSNAYLRPFERVGDLDLFEGHVWAEPYAAAPPFVTEALGMAVHWMDGAVLTAVPAVDILAFNRVIGLGLGDPVTEERLARIHHFYAYHGVSRFLVHAHPDAMAGRLPLLLESHGFRHHNNWVKLRRDVGHIPPAETDLRVAAVGPELARTVGSLLCRAFRFPIELQPVLSGVVGRLGWRAYLAVDGTTPVAAALMYTRASRAAFALAGTLPEHRGRGAQRALISRRIRDARALGCREVVVETGEDTPAHPSTSFRNMRQMGFDVAYVRANYVGEPLAPGNHDVQGTR